MSSPPPVAESPRVHVELVYFNIHARGELTRLCYAAAGRSGDYIDTRVPFFMESSESSRAAQEFLQDAPFPFLPYLKVTGRDGSVRHIAGDGEVEGFVAGQLDLMGQDEFDQYHCYQIATAAVGLLGPPLTRAGFFGNNETVVEGVCPGGWLGGGHVLGFLEGYVRELKERAGILAAGSQEGSKYIVASKLTLADLAIFNCLDECLMGPRGNTPLEGVEKVLQENYPALMATYRVVKEDLADYLVERQSKYHQP